MRFVFLVMTLFYSFIASAEAKAACEFKISCENGKKPFSIRFKSISEECTEDDMQAIFESNGQEKKLSLKQDMYMFTEHISKTQPSICKRMSNADTFAAYAVSKDQVLMFLKSSGRPGYDRVNAVLLNSTLGEVADFITLGTSKNIFIAVLKSKRGYKTRIIRKSLSLNKQVSCDCDASFIDEWMEIYVSDGKLKTSWSNM